MVHVVKICKFLESTNIVVDAFIYFGADQLPKHCS